MSEPTGGGGAHVRPRAIGNAAIYAAGSLVAKGSKFLLIPVYTAFLTAAEIGVVFFLEAVITLSSRFLSLSLGLAVRRYAAEHADAAVARTYARSVWLVGGIVAFVLAGVVMGGLAALADVWRFQVGVTEVAAAVVIGGVRSLLFVPQQFLIIGEQAKRHELFNISDMVVAAVLTVIAVGPLGIGVHGYLAAQAAAAALVAGAITFGAIGPGPVRVDGAQIAKALRYGIKGLPHFLFGWGLTFADRLVVERFLPISELGVYVIGYQFASVVPLFSMAMVNAYVAQFFRGAMHGDDRAEFGRRASGLATAIFALCLAVAAAAPEVVRLVAGPDYGAAARLMQILALGMGCHGLFQILLLPLYYQERTGTISAISGAALAVNVGLNVIFLPRVGVVAAAWATVASFAVAAVCAGALTWRSVGLVAGGPRQKFVLAAVVGGLVAVLLIPRPETLSLMVRAPLLVIGLGVLIVSLREPTVNLVGRALR